MYILYINVIVTILDLKLPYDDGVIYIYFFFYHPDKNVIGKVNNTEYKPENFIINLCMIVNANVHVNALTGKSISFS